MSMPYAILYPAPVYLGWALIHSLWQGLAVAVLLEIALVVAGNSRARLRYFLCSVALAALPVCLALTYWHLVLELPAMAPDTAFTSGLMPVSDPSQASASMPSYIPVGNSVPEAPAAIQPTPRASFLRDWNPVMPFVAWIWLASVVVLAARKAGGLLVLRRLRRCGVSDPDAAMLELFRRACARIGIDPQRVGMKISELVRVPMTMGWMSPVVLFPAALASGLSTSEIELILAHELAHVRRWDYLVNLLQAMAETLFFYHPMTWWISRRIRQEREDCCDDLVAHAPQDKLAYARTLVRLEELRGPGAALVTAATGGGLRRRIERLVGEPASGLAGGISIVLVLLLVLGAGAAVSVAKAQNSVAAGRRK